MATKDTDMEVEANLMKAFGMSSDVKPEFHVSTYAASQFYQPLTPKIFKAKSALLKNCEKPAKEALKALEILAEVRVKLNDGFDTEQIDLLIDHKINMNAQFTSHNAFDHTEDVQLDRLARLTEVRKKLTGTSFGLANLDDVLKKTSENLAYATGISRSHSYLTAHLPILSFYTPSFTLKATTNHLTLFFDDRTRHLALYEANKPFYHDGKEVSLSLRDIWKATWAESSTKVCLHVLKMTEKEMRYESVMVQMRGMGDPRGFLQKMSGVANFKLERMESEQMAALWARGPKSVVLPG